jgi:ubiquinone/menaquinone biosynthesis C-methylase UbiE
MRELERIGVDSFGLKARLYDFFMALPEALGLRRLRRDALCGLRGRVLEVGVGVGKNLPLYPPTVECVVGVDPDPAMLKKAEQRAREVPFPVELVLAGAEGLPLEEGSFDAVVSTLVFGTVAEPARAFEEVRRVLKGSGEFRLVEHAMM